MAAQDTVSWTRIMRHRFWGINTLKQKCCLWLALCLVVYILQRLVQSYYVPKKQLMLEIEEEGPPYHDGVEHHHRWIVVTTINTPTPSMVKLSQLPDWRMVVVGDMKTPADWNIKGVVFLSLEDQKRLNYAITTFLPYNSYSRKMIGYLYAIQHGAKLIYETDDDNTISSGFHEFLQSKEALHKILFVKTKNLTFNPYPHFGQPSLWPRGYPIEYIGDRQPRKYQLDDLDQITVFQGLISCDPDVDAIFRLTRVAKNTRPNVSLDESAPPIGLPPGTFSPFNSQSTFHTYDVFWALYMPITVTFRVTDIWRAYWAQALMWLSNQKLAYLPPVGYQIRNKHSLHRDMIEENDLYVKTGSLLKFLRSWRCGELHFFACVSKLTKDMAANSYWKSEESDILDAWLSDLSSLSYAPPAMVNSAKLKSKRINKLPIVQLQPNEQMSSLIHSSNYPANGKKISDIGKMAIQQTCPKQQDIRTSSKNRDIILIIGARYKKFIPFYEALYSSYFKYVIYCVLAKEDVSSLKVSAISIVEWNHLSCINEAMSIGYSVKGYLYVGPDLFVSREVLLKLTLSNTVVPNPDYVIVPTANYDHLCAEPHSRCASFLVRDIKQYLKRLYSTYQDISESQKQCISEKILKSKTDNDQVYFRDIVLFYIPKKFVNMRALLLEANSANVIYFLIPFMSCVDKHSTMLDVSNMITKRTENIIYPYVYEEMLARNKLHVSLFCSVV